MHLISLLLSFCCFSQASVIVIPSSQPVPRPYPTGPNTPVDDPRDLLLLSYKALYNNATSVQLMASSHDGLNASHRIFSTEDGFARGFLDAWVNHQHVVLRPDEVWFTILIQMNFYMTKHADDESVRNMFVSHQGKQNISVEAATLSTALQMFPEEIQKRVKTAWLAEWIFPNFSTTLPGDDHIVSAVLMMGLVKTYFKYHARTFACGIPSITLLGQQGDWQKLLEKLDRLGEFGPEPKRYGSQLRPVLSRLVKTFDDPNSSETRLFWSDCVRVRSRSAGCTSTRSVSGWINAFHFWNHEGNQLRSNGETSLQIDGVSYAARDIDDLPVAYATVPIQIKLFDEPKYVDSQLMAGLVGKKISNGSPQGYTSAAGKLKLQLPASLTEEKHSKLQPQSAWFLYRQKDGEHTYSVPNAAGIEQVLAGLDWTCMA
jgi:hypothetical protein